jgi:hypothetical protein
MNFISKIICSTYKYIKHLCGFANDADVAPDSKLSKRNTKIDSTATNDHMIQEKAIRDELSTTWPMKPAAKRKIAAKRKKAVKKTTRKSTKKPIKK